MMKLFSLFKKRHEPVESVENVGRVIDLSDNIMYPASVLTNFNYSFSLGDDDRSSMLRFIVYEFSKPSFRWGWDTITKEYAEEYIRRAVSVCGKELRALEGFGSHIREKDFSWLRHG